MVNFDSPTIKTYLQYKSDSELSGNYNFEDMHSHFMFGTIIDDGQGGNLPVGVDPRLGKFVYKRLKWVNYVENLIEELEVVNCIETDYFKELVKEESM